VAGADETYSMPVLRRNQRHQLGKRFYSERRMHQDHTRRAAEEGYVREIADRIIAWVLARGRPSTCDDIPARSACSRPGPRVPLTGRRRYRRFRRDSRRQIVG